MNLLPLSRMVRTVMLRVFPDTVQFRGQSLPANHLRFCGSKFRNDEYFIDSGKNEVKKLQKLVGLSADTRMLDVGCGPGRVALGILNSLGTIKRYEGIDVSAPAIHWCQQRLTPSHPEFHFHHTTVRNERYQPRGNNLDSHFRFPFGDCEFDLVYLYSVFSHMPWNEVELYLLEFFRILDEGGQLWFTAFIEQDVEKETINPDGYGKKKWAGPLLCVRFNEDDFMKLLKACGFTVTQVFPETEDNGQSAIIATKGSLAQ